MKPNMIKGLQKTTLIDFPDTLACTIFFGGCNFRCGYCYNSDLVFNGNLRAIPEKEVFDFLQKKKKYLDGVCVTGGEPTIHKNLPSFIKKIKKLGYKLKLDTNGSNPKMLKNLIKKKLLDYIAMDMKVSFENYDKVTGVKTIIHNINESIQIIKNSGLDYEFRTTIVPDVINEKEITEIGKLLVGTKKFFIQQFRPSNKAIDKKYNSMNPLGNERLEIFKKILSNYIKEVKIRNLD